MDRSKLEAWAMEELSLAESFNSVSSYILHNDSWASVHLRSVLPENIVKKILAVPLPVPPPSDGKDGYAWAGTCQ